MFPSNFQSRIIKVAQKYTNRKTPKLMACYSTSMITLRYMKCLNISMTCTTKAMWGVLDEKTRISVLFLILAIYQTSLN